MLIYTVFNNVGIHRTKTSLLLSLTKACAIHSVILFQIRVRSHLWNHELLGWL